jgi:hypothetical protein
VTDASSSPDAPEGVPYDEPGIARGAQSLLEVMAGLAAEGYAAEFRITRDDPPQLECLQCGRRFAPEEATPARMHRLEGASDPDEMLAVAALHCPHCALRGALTMGYGATADEGSLSVLERMPAPVPAQEI